MIIEIGGADLSGKSTQINKLKFLLQKENKLFCLAPSIIHEEGYCPNNFEERLRWYRNASADEITFAMLSDAKKQQDKLRDIEEIVMMDKGFYSFIGSCIARFMTKNLMNENEAKNRVEEIRKEVGYINNSSVSFILFLKEEEIYKKIINERNGKRFDLDFQEYLITLHKVFSNYPEESEKIFKIQASIDQEIISQKIMAQILKNL